MRRTHRLHIVAVAALAAMLLGAAAAHAAGLKALIVDGRNNHKWKLTTPVLKEILEASGRFSVAVATRPADNAAPFAPAFADYDVVVSNYNGTPWPEATAEAFVKYVSGGGGLVIVHAADNSFGKWEAYNEMIGLGGWGGRNEKSGPYVYYKDDKLVRDTSPGRGGGHGRSRPYQVVTRDSSHPIMAGLPVRWMHVKDELYAKLRGPAKNMTVLASAESLMTKRHEPILFTINYGKGRTFHTVLGHLTGEMRCVGFITTLQRGTEWAATGKVTLTAVPSDFPTAEKTSARTGSLVSPAAAVPAGAEFMGDWKGVQASALSMGSPLVAQVMALGKGTHQANMMAAFDTRDPMLAVLTGTVTDGKLVLKNDKGWTATIADGTFTRRTGKQTFSLTKVTRLSPTLGAKPPAGATVLLGPDSKDLDAWLSQRPGKDGKRKPIRWKLLPGGVMQCVKGGGGVISEKQFGDHKVHIEFRIPFEPTRRGQGRGNSGVYLQGRYEVQILDSYGLQGRSNECGGIYKVAAPRVNMCAPPLQWQSYDITFHAAKTGANKTPPRMTVLHNGVLVHKDQELPGSTTASPTRGVGPVGGIYLQDHGHPMEFRNVWVVEGK